MRLRFSMVCVLTALMAASGCAHTDALGRLDTEGFVSEDYPFRLQAGLLPGDDWLLDNVVPGRRSEEEPLRSKLGPEYRRRASLDADGDGRHEAKVKLRRYELRYRHRRSNALILLSVYPISERYAETELSVLARDYIDGGSGTGMVSVTVTPSDTQPSRVVGQSQRFATRMLDRARFSVGGLEALGTTYEIANVDQMRLQEQARWMRGRMVLIRAPWAWVHGNGQWPVLIQISYLHSPERFQEHAADFERFVDALQPFDDWAKALRVEEELKQCVEDLVERWGRARVTLWIDAEGQLTRLGSDAGFRFCDGRDKVSGLEATGRPRHVSFVIDRDGLRTGAAQGLAGRAEIGWPPASGGGPEQPREANPAAVPKPAQGPSAPQEPLSRPAPATEDVPPVPQSGDQPSS